MKIVLEHNGDYVAVDTVTSRYSGNRSTIDSAVATIQAYVLGNSEIHNCASEAELLAVMATYHSYKFIQFVYDEPTSYEFW
jgi:hypothetical protein